MMDNRQNEQLLSHLKAVWRRRQTQHLTAGVLAFCQWVMPLFLVAVTIDWLTRLPAPVRVVILAILVVVSLYKAWCCGWRHARAFNATHTALQVEEHYGGLESLLVTAVQFGHAGPPRGMSQSLYDLTHRRAEQATANLCAEEVVGFRELRRPATAVVIFVLLIGAFAVVNGPFLAAGMARIFAPWLPVQSPTRTHLELKSGDMVVKEGGSVQIRARVSGVIPSSAKIALQTGGKYFRATGGEDELDKIYEEISKMEKKELASLKFSQFEDRFQYLLIIVIIVLVLEFFISERKKVKTEWLGRF